LGGLGANPADAGKSKSTLSLARLCEHRNQMEQAERLYHQVLQRNPSSEVALHRLGVIAARRGKLKEAEEYFSHALALKPNNAELLGDIGYFYYVAGRMKDAERYLRRGLEVEPNSRVLANNLAMVVGAEGRDAESLALFQRAGMGAQADANLGFVLAQRGEYQKSLDAYNRALTDDNSMRTAAEAMIELSKRVPDRRVAPPATAPDPLAIANTPIPPAPVAPNRPATEITMPLQDGPPPSQFNHGGGSQYEIAGNPAFAPSPNYALQSQTAPPGYAPQGGLQPQSGYIPPPSPQALGRPANGPAFNGAPPVQPVLAASWPQVAAIPPRYSSNSMTVFQPAGAAPGGYSAAARQALPESAFQHGAMSSQYNAAPASPTQTGWNPAGAAPREYDGSVQQAPPAAWSQPAAAAPQTGYSPMPAPPPGDRTNSAAYEEPATNAADAAAYGPADREVPAQPGHLARFPSLNQ
jgi:Tfp pilus assembly protein PilF